MEELLAAKGEVVKKIEDETMDTVELTPEDIVGWEKAAILTGSGEGKGGRDD